MCKDLTIEQLKEKMSDKLYELTEIENNGLRGVGSEEWHTVTDEYEELLHEWRLRQQSGHSNLDSYGNRFPSD
jgi:hypothetical protein